MNNWKNHNREVETLKVQILELKNANFFTDSLNNRLDSIEEKQT